MIILKKCLILFFIILNFYSSIHWNFLEFFESRFDHLSEKYSSEAIVKAKKFMWWYPYLFGIDQRYTMFSTVHRNRTELVFYGVGENDKKLVYPIENQSERTFMERNFIDHKRGKLYLILYSQSEFGREAYSQYLYRKYADTADFEITKLAVDINWQEIYPIDKARSLGYGFSTVKHTYKTEYYDIKN